MPYEKSSPASPEAQSASSYQENLKALAVLFPSVVRDGQVDVEALRQLCGEAVVKEDELFGLNWRGKAEARRAALTPSLGTLRPCKEESKEWDTTQNLYIEGDNLEVLKLLRKSYGGKVKMIYIDPPYNTGNDFVYPDDYQHSIENYKKLTGQVGKYAANTETSGRYHTDWLNMMYPRLVLARDLLSEDGVLFISIDDNEQSNLIEICNEVMGEASFAAVLHCQMSTTQGMKVKAAQEGNIVKNAEYILCYTKNGRKDIASSSLLYDLRPKYDEHYSLYLRKDYTIGKISELYDYRFPRDCHNKQPYSLSEAYQKSSEFADVVRTHLADVVRTDKITGCDLGDGLQHGMWKSVSRNGRNYILTKDKNGKICQLLRLIDSWGKTDGFYGEEGLRKIRGDWWEGFYIDMGNVSKEGDVDFKNGKKPVRLIRQLAKMSCEKDAIILDFFSGSATTAHAVMQLNAENDGNRRFIMVQLPEPCDEKNDAYKAGYKNICEIGKERIRRAGKKVKEEAGLAGQKLDIGFRVYKLDSSNVKAWNPQAEDLATAVNNYAEHLVGGRTEEDFLTEIMLKSGIDLVEDIAEREIAGHRVQSLGYGQYYACMAADLAEDAEDVALGIAAWHEEDCAFSGGEQKDTCTVFVSDRAFASNDAAKMNFVAILEQHGICNIKAL